MFYLKRVIRSVLLVLCVLLLGGVAPPPCQSGECKTTECRTDLDCGMKCRCSQDLDEESTGVCVPEIDPPL
jgi:hypothetical protein